MEHTIIPKPLTRSDFKLLSDESGEREKSHKGFSLKQLDFISCDNVWKVIMNNSRFSIKDVERFFFVFVQRGRWERISCLIEVWIYFYWHHLLAVLPLAAVWWCHPCWSWADFCHLLHNSSGQPHGLSPSMQGKRSLTGSYIECVLQEYGSAIHMQGLRSKILQSNIKSASLIMKINKLNNTLTSSWRNSWVMEAIWGALDDCNTQFSFFSSSCTLSAPLRSTDSNSAKLHSHRPQSAQ